MKFNNINTPYLNNCPDCRWNNGRDIGSLSLSDSDKMNALGRNTQYSKSELWKCDSSSSED